jgi:peptide/nickel transport system permease protein
MAQASNTSSATAVQTAGRRDALARFERQTRIQSPWRMIGRRMWANRMAMVGVFIITLILLMAFLSRVIHGSRLSLKVGLISVVIAMISGSILGLVAGYAGGWFDMLSQRVMDVMLAFPELILALAIMAVLGPSLRNAMIAIGISAIPVYTRVMRGQVLSLREKEYVEAARAAGAGHMRLIFRHILPNTFSSMIVISTLGIAGAILAGSGLSFIGLGAQPPQPEWGAMLASGREYLRHEWWIATFPGIFIAVTVLGFNLMGDGLRDAFDPRAIE